MIADGQTFKGKRIHLDGSSFTDCRFEACTLVVNGLMGCELNNPTFDACTWEMQGPAKETLLFLAALYKGGGKELVEGTFNQIRGTQEPGAGPSLN